jgi:hypothetical protein
MEVIAFIITNILLKCCEMQKNVISCISIVCGFDVGRFKNIGCKLSRKNPLNIFIIPE